MEIKITKGLDLPLKGSVKIPFETKHIKVSQIAVAPDDFEGFVPKTEVRVNQSVVAGEALLYHKGDSRIKIVSPVNGTVSAIERGERRHIERIVIDCKNEESGNQNASTLDYTNATPTQLIELLAQSGLLVFIRRRPYADIPPVNEVPRDIFVTAFDSAPLATNSEWSEQDFGALHAGASFLAKITPGKVFVSVRTPIKPFNIKGVETVIVEGPHPAGLPGVQAANIAPVNKGETIWTLSAETMWRIGRYILTGHFDATTYVTVCGSEIRTPYVAKTIIGVDCNALLNNELNSTGKNLRIISGNVLTGIKISGENYFLHYPYTQLTVIPEGDDVEEFMGWASLSPKKLSVSPSYPGRFFKRFFNPDARINGGRRAMIMSGEYDRVFPMDIMPEFLIKAIRSRDIEKMEKLGIYEVAPEDFALAEFIDSSKLPLQKIVREGLDFMRKELQ